MRPFGCPVTIFNTLYHLGKFDEKANEGFFVGYSTNCKSLRVFNSRIKIVEENLHVKFNENTPNITGSGPNWPFDIDSLTKSMNYKPVVAGIQFNGSTGEGADIKSLDTYFQVSHVSTTIIHKDHPLNQVIGDVQSAIQTKKTFKNLEEHGFVSTVNQRTNHKDLQNYLFACLLSQEEPKKMDVKSAFLYDEIEDEVYVCQPPGFEDPYFPDRVYKVEKALYGLHQAPRAWFETLSTYSMDNGFQIGNLDKTLFIKRDKSDILLVQVYVDDIIFGSTRKELCTEFEKI
nr:retrovirus-related Pol polyprotein from transposon TNT 1-94 [Tanacetum cinerariifolium]